MTEIFSPTIFDMTQYLSTLTHTHTHTHPHMITHTYIYKRRSAMPDGVGHFTQVVWDDTTHVGMAFVGDDLNGTSLSVCLSVSQCLPVSLSLSQSLSVSLSLS